MKENKLLVCSPRLGPLISLKARSSNIVKNSLNLLLLLCPSLVDSFKISVTMSVSTYIGPMQDLPVALCRERGRVDNGGILEQVSL